MSTFYASPSAAANGDGTIGNPWQLASALQSLVIKPGDTLYLRAGKYINPNNNPYFCFLNGTSTSPIIVRNYTGEQVIISGLADWQDCIHTSGDPNHTCSYVWFWGLELTSEPGQKLQAPGCGFNLGIYGGGDGIKIINCIIHDCVAMGINWEVLATRGEVNGCLIYNNGRMMDVSNGAHNYGIYTQNNDGNGTKLIKDNIFWDNWNLGLHIYAEQSGVSNITIDGNVVVSTGQIWNNPNGGTFQTNLLIGAAPGTSRNNISVINNHLYYPSASIGHYNLEFGYGPNPFTNGTFSNNTVTEGMMLFNVSPLTSAGNLFYNTAGDQTAIGTYAPRPTSGVSVIIRKNDYEPTRANVIVYNWAGSPSVQVDLSTFIAVGSNYVVKDAENYFGTVVASGTYTGGKVSIPMTSKAFSVPVTAPGDDNTGIVYNTQPTFGVFIVTSPDGIVPPVQLPTGSFAVTPTSIIGSGSVTLTWTANNATTATIDNGVGAVAITGGSKTLTVSTTTTFTLTLNNASGTKTYTAAVTVNPVPPSVPTGTLIVSPTSIVGTGSVTLTWTANNATTASIDNGVGTVATTGGSKTATVSASTTFTLTLSNVSGTKSYTAAVTVNPVPPPVQALPTVALSNVTSTSAQMSGVVNPNGDATTYYFKVGTTASYGSTTPTTNAGAGTTPVLVLGTITGLSPATLYHYCLVATNSGGTVSSSDATFITSAAPVVLPTPVTLGASNITTTTAQVNGTVNGNGMPSTYYFEYGTTTSYGTKTPVQKLLTSTTPQTVNAAITGLTAGTLYHFRLNATNTSGTVNGADLTFTATPSTQIQIGSNVYVTLTTDCINARTVPSITNSVALKCEPAGTNGVVVDGPSPDVNGSSTYTFWKVAYSDGITGWSAGQYLVVGTH